MAKTSYVPNPAKIKVIGLGGGGCNAITRMVKEEIQGVEFIAMNSDAQALALTEAPVRIQLGDKLTRGLGVGGDHNLGSRAAEESRDELSQALHGGDMVFITAGMGGGTGTGAAPVIAEIAKQSGALTIAIVTRPFTFEGARRTQVADEGITRLLGKVDTLIIVPNDRLLNLIFRHMKRANSIPLARMLLKIVLRGCGAFLHHRLRPRPVQLQIGIVAIKRFYDRPHPFSRPAAAGKTKEDPAPLAVPLDEACFCQQLQMP